MVQSAEHIEPRRIKALSQLQPWRTVMAIVLDWTVIAAAIAISELTQSWLVWLVAVPVIAGRMHALAVLMHDFAHYRFMKNKAVSDWIGDVFCAWPVGVTVEGYRVNHLAHHRYLNTDQDPDWVAKLGSRTFTFPQEMRFALLNVAGYFVGVSSMRDLHTAFVRLQADDHSSLNYKLLRYGSYALVFVILTLGGWWTEYFFYWAIPYLTGFFLLLYIRSVAEHFGETMDYSEEMTGTRTVIPYFWERWFFCPHNVSYHLEHHEYPSVPFYNLPALNRELMRSRGFSQKAHITRGFATGLLREVWLDSWRKPQATAGV